MLARAMNTGWSKFRGLVLLALLLLVSRSAVAASADAALWRVGPVPAWVVDAKAANTPALAPNGSSDGQRYLLYVHEVRVAESVHSFTHTSRLITNEAGLQATSQLNVELDSSYETLILHYVRVKRGGSLIDELDPKAIKQVERQADLQNQVYDSRKSVVLFLPDLRVGDVVDMAYTLSGADPTLEGVYDSQLLLGGPVPIDHLFARISSPKPLKLTVAILGPTLSARTLLAPHINADQTDYRWDLRDTPAYVVEPGAPTWFSPVPFATVTAFGSWRDVAAWGRRLFEPAPPLSGAALDFAKQARQTTATDAEFLLRATRFVQDEVRYVGMEVGLGRRLPGDPNVTFQRRYGDCKDKTALLIALLRSGGIPAEPVLASSGRGPVLDQGPPSAATFDHVVVRAMLEGRPYFIDPTLVLQGGQLNRFLYSWLGYVLVLSPDSAQLSHLLPDPGKEPQLEVTDSLQLPAPGEGTEATLVSTRVYRRGLADQMRAELRAKSSEQITKSYLELYEATAPGAHVLEPIQPVDEREADRLSVVVRLGVPKPWTVDEHRGNYVVNVSIDALKSALVRPESSARRSPLAVPFPFHGRQTVSVHLPFDLPAVSTKPTHLATSSTGFDFSASYANRVLTYRSEVFGFAPEVASGEMPAQLALVDQARVLMQRAVLRNTLAAQSESGLGSVNWLMAVLLLGLAAGAARLAFGALRRDVFVENTRQGRGFPEPLGGWLWLLGFNVLIFPFALGFGQLKGLQLVLSAARWRALTSPELDSYRPGLAVLCVLEAVIFLLLFVYSVVVALSFVQKLRSFPWHFTVMIVATTGFSLVDRIAGDLVSTAETTFENWAPFVRMLLFGLIWINYVRYSKRVSRTFTRNPGRALPVVDAEAEPKAELAP